MSLSASATNPPRRADLAWKHAPSHVLKSAHFTISLARWCAAPEIRDPLEELELEHREARVLAWFAALHRGQEIGYLGTAAELDLVAAAVRRASLEACSRSTLERALRGLVEKGWLLKSYTYASHGREVRGVFMRDRIVVLTLTKKARDLWSHTPEHKASKRRRSDRPSASEAPSFEGSSAREEILRPCSLEALEAAIEEPLRGAVGHRAGSAGAAEVPRTEPRPIAPLAELADCLEVEPQTACHLSPRWTAKPSARPRGTRPKPRRAAIEALLETIAAVTYGRGRLERAARARATLEIYAGGSALDSSGIDWDYWIARWPELTREERRRLCRAEIVPLLASRPPSSLPPPPPARSSSSSSPPPPARSSSSSSPPPPPPPPPPAGEELELDPANPYSGTLERILRRLAAREEGGS